ALKLAEDGKRLVQETRGWDETKGRTVSQRSKESAHDYRYFPEPDLPPLVLNRDWVEELSGKIPEMPENRRDRFVTKYKLSPYEVNLLISSKAMADYFEDCFKTEDYKELSPEKGIKEISNTLLGEISRIMNSNNIDIVTFKNNVSPQKMVRLLVLVSEGIVSSTTAKSVLEEMFQTGKAPAEIIQELGLHQISDVSDIETVASRVITDNIQAVNDYKAGKVQILKFLIGQVMMGIGGRANHRLVSEILDRKLKEG
ncbi:Asp-tRNA(Asn)/Glu-tRNA(Gln) amidotransferase GatCAB subunit B, partial [Chloroflexota bacterium]